MAHTRRMHKYVPNPYFDHAAILTAETHLRMAARYTKDFMCLGMKVIVVIDTVPPRRLPRVRGEKHLKNSRRVGSACKADRTAIEEEGKTGIIRRLAIVLKENGVSLTRSGRYRVWPGNAG